MRHTNPIASLTLFAIVASLASAAPAQAEKIASYTLVDLGNPTDLTNTSYPTIDSSGNLINGFQRYEYRNHGVYQLGSIQDTIPGYNNVTLSNYLHANGGDANLLPPLLQDAVHSSPLDVNSSGIVIGHSANGPFIYSVGTGQFLNVQGTSGQTEQPFLKAINDAGQIVGDDNNYHAILYGIPTAVPILLTDLLPANSRWKLLTATDINDRGDIVGVGTNPAGQRVVYELVPVATPEPSTLALIGFGVLLYGGWRVRSRIPRP